MASLLNTQTIASFLLSKLMQCAKAIEGGKLDLADSLLAEIQSLASKEASIPTKKVVNYCAEALVRRVCGIRSPYPLLLSLFPPLHPYVYMHFPLHCFSEITTKHAIADAFISGNKRLHIIDFSLILDPWDWGSVIKALKRQHGDLKSVLLTSILPKLRKRSDHTVEEWIVDVQRDLTGDNVNLEWRQLRFNTTGDIVKCIYKLRRKGKDEMVIVKWNFILHQLLAQDGAIEQVLSKVKDLKPDVMVIVEQEANLNCSDFSNRLQQSFQYYSSIFELLFLIESSDEKVIWERYFRRQIGNVVACEGIDRVERIESFAQWQHRLSQAGFCPVPQRLKDFPYEFQIKEKDGHLLLYGRWYYFPLAVASVWKCIDPSQFHNGPNIMQDMVENSEMASSSESQADDANDPHIMRDRNIRFTQGPSINRIAASAFIYDILEYTCLLHNLPLAVTWIYHGQEGITNSKGKHILCIDDNACYMNYIGMAAFVEGYAKHPLEEGKGIAGKALQSNIHIEHDISVLDRADRPFGSTILCLDSFGAFAVRLTSTHTCNDDYILQFLLPEGMKEISEQKLLIDKVLCTLQMNCSKLWILCCREQNETNSPEVRFEDFRMSNILPAAVSRTSLLPLSNDVLDECEIVALGTVNAASDQAEDGHEPLEQVLFLTVFVIIFLMINELHSSCICARLKL